MQGNPPPPLPESPEIAVLAGAMALATRAYWRLQGSPWVLEYPYCPQRMTPTHPTGDKRLSKKSNFNILKGH